MTRVIGLAAMIALSGACQQAEPPQASVETAAAPQDDRPNILFIMADDLGYTDVGFFGGDIPTPNLDALAFEGLRLTNFHVAPACMQTRAMLMSGTTNREAGVVQHNDPLRGDVATLPERLRTAGYHTYMAGKWNLGVKADEGPAVRGFESSYALMYPADNHLGHSAFTEDHMAYRENGEPVTLPENWFSSRLYTDKLIEYIDANAADGVPWFGYLAFTAPHWPLQAEDNWIDRYAGRYDDGYDVLREVRVEKAAGLGVFPDGLTLEGYARDAAPWATLAEKDREVFARAMEVYAAMTEDLDMQVGRLVEYLEASGELANTVIVFTSDNGASGSDSSFVPRTVPRTDTDNSLANMGREWSYTAYGRGWSEAATAPYRAVKGSLHSGGTLAATFVHHGSVASPGGLDHTYLTIMDLLPTFVEIAGEPSPGSEFQGRAVLPVRGRSFWGLVQGETLPADVDATPWMTTEHRRALVRWPWKIVTEQVPRLEGSLRWSLFNLEDDPGERRDLSERNPEMKSELMAVWAEYGRRLDVQ